MKSRLSVMKIGGAWMATLMMAAGSWANGVDCVPLVDPDCSTEVRLLAGQYIEVGKVIVQSNSEEICVTYQLSEEALAYGWLIYETHLAIAGDLADIPQTSPNKWGTNPIPGHFPYSETFCEGESCWSVCVDLDDLGILPGESVYIAAHAVVGFVDETYGYAFETAWGEGERFNERGNWGMYFMYQLCQPVIVPSYIGYEDGDVGCDFDYNDFGMDMYVEEDYDGDVLTAIHMEFLARVNIAANVHDIHIKRPLYGNYTYTIVRDEAAAGTEKPAGVYAGSGDFDIIVFDTANWGTLDGGAIWVGVDILMDVGNNLNLITDFGPAPRFDIDEMFSLYDPYMYNRSTGFIVGIAGLKDAVAPLPLVPVSEYQIPCVLVVPTSDWPHPGEGVVVTNPYPMFYDYYTTQSPTYADWWVPSP